MTYCTSYILLILKSNIAFSYSETPLMRDCLQNNLSLSLKMDDFSVTSAYKWGLTVLLGGWRSGAQSSGVRANRSRFRSFCRTFCCKDERILVIYGWRHASPVDDSCLCFCRDSGVPVDRSTRSRTSGGGGGDTGIPWRCWTGSRRPWGSAGFRESPGLFPVPFPDRRSVARRWRSGVFPAERPSTTFPGDRRKVRAGAPPTPC